ncbi:YcjX family GTP-binding protein [Basilea psittacipulmonis]|uniref:YcjX family protein n=1 Tax=Basilea psittacipulmonis DSM 24701 TaxID=1072685 RepID=A0A077DCB1_9BURK|nr:YcjX family protein [Basilea psittacipulmonis]AIL32535.1 hypothetical protein IX83_03740 [Basilea psittacipulmonis DSM 24701]
MAFFDSLKEELSQKYEQLFDQQLRIAVTGLTRSGKTAFITSLINQLLTLDEDKNKFPAFKASREGRIQSVRIIPHLNKEIASFPYDENIAGLSQDPPQWPMPTSVFREVRLEIKYRYKPGLWRQIGLPPVLTDGTLYLDIVDYPGEWLLDLPLLDLSYERWSQSSDFLSNELRQEMAQDWLHSLNTLDLKAKADYQQIKQIAQQYTEFLLACKRKGLENIQPARFVMPKGVSEDAPVYDFFPLVHLLKEDWAGLLSHAEKHPDSTIAVLMNHYDYYVNHYVKDFYEKYFKRFDRQVVLIDCLTPLNHSNIALTETKQALQGIFEHFSYGTRSLFHRLFSPQIDKLMFVATKLDHITTDQKKSLESLLEHLILDSKRVLKINDIRMDNAVIASIRATVQVSKVDENGVEQRALKGRLKKDGQEVYIYPGEVPHNLMIAKNYQEAFEFDEYLPLPLDENGSIRQLNMDKVMSFLLDDKLE